MKYTVCPHCEHPNVHVQDGKIKSHTAATNTHVECLGSGMEANEQHEQPLSRHESAYDVALQMSQHRAFGLVVPERETTRPAFTVWAFSGLQFIAVPIDSGSFHVMDALGGNYGAWMTVEKFRKLQQAGDLSAWQSLGRAHLQCVCNRD